MTSQPEETHHDYMFVIHERKWIIVLAFLGVMAATAYFTLKSPDVYEAGATLMVDPGARNSGVLQVGYRPAGSNLIQNYCQVISSRTVAEKTAQRLAGDPRYRSWQVGSSRVDDLMRRISATPIRGTDMILVTARAPTAQEAAIISNAAVDVFIEQQIALVRGEYTEQRQFLEEQIPQILDRLREAEERLKEFKETNKFVALSEEAKSVTEKLAESDKIYSEVQTDINTSTTRLNYLRRQLAEQQKNLPEDIAKVSSPYILELRKQIVNLETAYSMYLVQGLPEDHPKMLDLKTGIDEAKANLVEETRQIGTQGIPSLDPLSSARELVDTIVGLEAEVVTLWPRFAEHTRKGWKRFPRPSSIWPGSKEKEISTPILTTCWCRNMKRLRSPRPGRCPISAWSTGRSSPPHPLSQGRPAIFFSVPWWGWSWASVVLSPWTMPTHP
jgi:succinoglycan biosynthesis transport protein ExoP